MDSPFIQNYLKFSIREPLRGARPRKTPVWQVCSLNSDSPLGNIGWHGPWRRYIFQPVGSCIFDVACLTDICTFINDLMLERDPAKKYNPNYGDERICSRKKCGHTYYRHFDWAETERDFHHSCKYCGCDKFKWNGVEVVPVSHVVEEYVNNPMKVITDMMSPDIVTELEDFHRDDGVIEEHLALANDEY